MTGAQVPIKFKPMLRVTLPTGEQRALYIDIPCGGDVKKTVETLKAQYPLCSFELLGNWPFITDENAVPIVPWFNMQN